MYILGNIFSDVFASFLDALGYLLAVFYSVIPSAGIAIILLTMLLRLIVYPLTAKQAKSMLSMQRAQPEIKKLQAKYKDDKQKLNEEMMAFYKENQINPFGGCLPLLLQMPIFISLYQLLNDIPKHLPKTGRFSAFYNEVCIPAGVNTCNAKPKAPSPPICSRSRRVRPSQSVFWLPSSRSMSPTPLDDSRKYPPKPNPHTPIPLRAHASGLPPIAFAQTYPDHGRTAPSRKQGLNPR